MSISVHHKVELLAPAGNREKLEIVLHYGADAVYLADQSFSLRNLGGNFNLSELGSAIALTHKHQAKAYVAVNIFARNQHLNPLREYLSSLAQIKPDGIIASDPAVITLAQKIAPHIPIHLSTQTNTTNLESVRFWQTQGVSRINLARELSLKEVAMICRHTQSEIETFVHGAMCISYSGRCLLSNFMAQRPSNQGMCCQPCRFQYAVMEATRPGQFFPIAEDSHGTYVFNSRDLCMLSHLPDLIKTGVHALKIEGRMKGIHYAATVVKIYREAIDAYYQNPDTFTIRPYWQQELNKISGRGYCTGFYLNDPREMMPYNSPPQTSAYTLAGKVLNPVGKYQARIQVRNQIRVNDPIEIIRPKGAAISDTVSQIINDNGQAVAIAQPGSHINIQLNHNCQYMDLIRGHVKIPAP